MRRNALALVVALAVLAPGIARGGVVVTPGGVRFTQRAPNATSVALAGSFNDWSSSANPMVKEDGAVWSTVVRLKPGVHEYKFVVDGEWLTDADNPVTAGSFGNSAIQIGADGQLKEMEATSNTPYNTAVRLGGRFRNIFLTRQNPDQNDRFELRRPLFEVDLDFGASINDVLDARLLLKVNNEAENVEVWKTRLNFDRGHITYDSGTFQLTAWDNEGQLEFDSPLQLVGDIGIYSYKYGYDTQGVGFRKPLGRLSVAGMYADNFLDGGQSGPQAPVIVPRSTQVALLDGVFVPTRASTYNFTNAWYDEDVAAARVKLDLFWGLVLGGSARWDRGFNPNGFGTIVPGSVRPDTLDIEVTTAGGTLDTLATPGVSYDVDNFQGWEEWWGIGTDLQWIDLIGDADFLGEVLIGRSRATGRDGGTRNRVFLGTFTEADSTVAGFFEGTDELIVNETDRTQPVPLPSRGFDLAESARLHAGFRDFPLPFGFRFGGSAEWMMMRHTPLSTGLAAEIENEAYVWRADARWPLFGETIVLGLGAEAWDFQYDPDTPWTYQFWFDDRNFWLDNGQDKVKYERLTFLGGDDALFYRPMLGLNVFSKRLRFRYDGTLGLTGVNREPKYWESLLRGWFDVTSRWTLHADLRVVRYDDPVLDFRDTFDSAFLEAAWNVTPDVNIALSWGVDPTRFDVTTNEYGYIGRDQFLFDRGANSATARTNFEGLGEAIQAAEREMTEERVIQLEAVVKF